MTLTTETIKLWRNNAGITAGETAEDDPEHIAAKAILALTAEILANREAQPVAWHFPGSDTESAQLGYDHELDDEQKRNCIALYTAPPAPAVPEEMTPEMLRAVQLHSELGAYAAANLSGAYGMFAEFWKVACRAAMLAQPVSSGYKLPEGWIACSERMPELDKRVLLYFGSYGGHIEDGCIGDDGDGPYHYFFDGDSLQQEPTHWMPLPAAPEGGNG